MTDPELTGLDNDGLGVTYSGPLGVYYHVDAEHLRDRIASLSVEHAEAELGSVARELLLAHWQRLFADVRTLRQQTADDRRRMLDRYHGYLPMRQAFDGLLEIMDDVLATLSPPEPGDCGKEAV